MCLKRFPSVLLFVLSVVCTPKSRTCVVFLHAKCMHLSMDIPPSNKNVNTHTHKHTTISLTRLSGFVCMLLGEQEDNVLSDEWKRERESSVHNH